MESRNTLRWMKMETTYKNLWHSTNTVFSVMTLEEGEKMRAK
jgi:hypothetical protein